MKKPIVSSANDKNHINGSDAEQMCAARLILACGAEAKWGSRYEDGRKIDLVITFEHPWIEKEAIQLMVQVKSGDSYGRELENGFSLKKRAVKAVRRSLNNVCVAWQAPNTANCYWAYVHPNTRMETKEYGRNHQIDPCIRYDLARCVAKYYSHQTGGKGIIIKSRGINSVNIKDERKKIKDIYKSFDKGILNPVLGKIELTRYGWRHMFRDTRKMVYKTNSLEIIPYLNLLLSRYPTNHYITDVSIKNEKVYRIRRTKYLLSYSDVSYERKRQKVDIRLVEQIGFPKEWFKSDKLSQRIVREVYIESCSIKE